MASNGGSFECGRKRTVPCRPTTKVPCQLEMHFYRHLIAKHADSHPSCCWPACRKVVCMYVSRYRHGSFVLRSSSLSVGLSEQWPVDDWGMSVMRASGLNTCLPLPGHGYSSAFGLLACASLQLQRSVRGKGAMMGTYEDSHASRELGR
jgi:hypothetical protein